MPAKQLGDKRRSVESSPQAYALLRVSTAVFADAVGIFEQSDDQSLSFTDATTVALCRRHDIDSLMSFNDEFDGIVSRIDPATM